MGSRAGGLQVGSVALGLPSTGSIAAAHGRSCSVARGVLPAQGLKPGLLHWQADSFTTEPPEKRPFLNFSLGLREREAFIPTGTSKKVDVTPELPAVSLVPRGTACLRTEPPWRQGARPGPSNIARVPAANS